MHAMDGLKAVTTLTSPLDVCWPIRSVISASPNGRHKIRVIIDDFILCLVWFRIQLSMLLLKRSFV